MHALLPTYMFPPLVTPGSLRLGRFVEHFVDLGGRVSVVTVPRDDYRHDWPTPPPLDETLLERLPPEVRVHRTAALGPRRLASLLDRLRLGRLHRAWHSPDAMIRWRSRAVQACLGLLKADPADCIYTSSNPLSCHLIGLELVRRTGLPWVAEFRDPWIGHPEKGWESKGHFWYERHLQSRVLRRATAIIMNTPCARARLLSDFSRLSPDKVYVVTNGFQPADVQATRRARHDTAGRPLVLAYVGTMRVVGPDKEPARRGRLQRWKHSLDTVGRYQPHRVVKTGRSPWYIAAALAQLIGERPELRDHLRLVLAGGFPAVPDAPQQLARLIARFGLEGVVEYRGELPYQQALSVMDAADVLVLNQAFLPDNGPMPFVPAKTYEYLAMGKPILGLLPQGDAREFLLRSGLGSVVPPDDVPAIAEAIFRLYEEHASAGICRTPDAAFIAQFRSDRLAARAWEILQSAARFGRTVPP